jgi:uncharacterized protein YkwD
VIYTWFKRKLNMLARGLAVLGLLVLSVSSAHAETRETAKVNLHPVEANMIKYTNDQRARHGLPPLVVDAALHRSAQRHAAWMTNTQTLRHTSASVGENIAEGQSNSHEAVQDWMNSPGHRANMLNRGYTRIGAAAYTARNGRRFWCLQFLR